MELSGNEAKKEDKKARLSRNMSKDKSQGSFEVLAKNQNLKLPQHIKDKLNKLFTEIEGEFLELYTENVNLRKEISVLNEQLNHESSQDKTDGAEQDTQKSSTLKNKSGSNQFSQKIKTTYKTGTSKLVSSFKSTVTPNCSFAHEFYGHKDGVWHVDASNIDQNVCASASADKTVKLWSLNSGNCYLSYAGHYGSVNYIKFHPKERILISASGDSSVHVWSYKTPPLTSSSDDDCYDDEIKTKTLENVDIPMMKCNCHEGAVVACDWVMDGSRFVTASWDRTACLIDSETTEVVQTLSGHELQLTHVSTHPTNKLIVTSSHDSTFRVCDFRVSTKHTVIVGQGHSHSVTSAVFTNDDKVVSGSDDRTVKVWDLKNMAAPLTTIHLDSPVNRLAVNSKGVIAIPHDNRHIRLFDLTGVRLARLPRNERECHRRVVAATTWVPYSDHHKVNLLSCGWDKMVFGWSIDIPSSLINVIK